MKVNAFGPKFSVNGSYFFRYIDDCAALVQSVRANSMTDSVDIDRLRANVSAAKDLLDRACQEVLHVLEKNVE